MSLTLAVELDYSKGLSNNGELEQNNGSKAMMHCIRVRLLRIKF